VRDALVLQAFDEQFGGRATRCVHTATLVVARGANPGAADAYWQRFFMSCSGCRMPASSCCACGLPAK
jgi:hypothetical protein